MAQDFSIVYIRVTRSKSPGYIVFETRRGTGAFESRKIGELFASQHLYELRAGNPRAEVANIANVFVRSNGPSLARIIAGNGSGRP